MGDMLKTGSDWLARQQREHVSQSVHYVRASASIEIPATIGRSTFEQSDGGGFSVVPNTADFIIAADDLEIDGEPTAPAIGDRIIVGDLEDGRVYEVGRQNGVEPFAWVDEYRTRFRVHTKYVGRQPPAP